MECCASLLRSFGRSQHDMRFFKIESIVNDGNIFRAAEIGQNSQGLMFGDNLLERRKREASSKAISRRLAAIVERYH